MDAAAIEGFVKALGGGVGALFSTTVLYPLEVTKTKVQAFAGEASTDEGFDEEKHQAMGNTFRALHHTWKREGSQALLAPWAPGWPSTCLDQFVFNFVYYYFYESFMALWRSLVGHVTNRANMLIATAAGAVMQLTTLPLQNHSTRMQTQTERRSNWATALGMYKEDGLKAFYKGLLPCLLLSVNASIQDTIYDTIKNAWLRRTNRKKNTVSIRIGLTAGQAFWLGLGSKLIASTVCYPLTRVKQMCQAQTKRPKRRHECQKGDVAAEPLNMFEMAMKVYRADGLRGFVYGIEGQVFNASLKAALNRMVKERIQVLIFFLLFPNRFRKMREAARLEAGA